MLCFPAGSRAVTFDGTTARALEYTVGASTGLDAVYVLPSTAGVTMTYEAGDAATAVWYRFSNLGGAYAERISSTVDGNKLSARAEQGDMGYIIEDAGRRSCFWVVDYSAHKVELEALTPASEQECDRTALELTGNAAEIPYYGINGRRFVLSRELKLTYNTLDFDEGNFTYVQKTSTTALDAVTGTIRVESPLCSTSFRLSGDRFTEAWGGEESVESAVFQPLSVAAQTRATQEQDNPDNQQKTEGAELGGSAPCTIAFEAAVTDEAVFREWQISRSPEFGINENTFSDLQFEYTFREQGKTYVRFVANNATGTCEYAGPTYEIFIGESKLDIPNAFSPDASPGVNDEWKVSYRSLVSYECHIFNRWGKELFRSTNPAEGWDGRSGGKFVPSGVYFYVIKARGADGVDYNRAGDINIIRYRNNTQTKTELP